MQAPFRAVFQLSNEYLKKKFNMSQILQGFSGGTVVKNLPSIQETGIRSLDQKDPMEREMATHSSILV